MDTLRPGESVRAHFRRLKPFVPANHAKRPISQLPPLPPTTSSNSQLPPPLPPTTSSNRRTTSSCSSSGNALTLPTNTSRRSRRLFLSPWARSVLSSDVPCPPPDAPVDDDPAP